MRTFPIGGIHPSDNKEWSKDKAIETLELPSEVYIPMIQHIGAPSTPIVKKGDKVLTGQLIGQSVGFVSANIHASVSGTVTSVDAYPNGQGQRRIMVVIKREGDEWVESIDRSTELKRECTLTSEQIIAKVKDAGIVGLGGAQFPTHVKLSVPNDQKAEVLIINGVECEPYLTSDYRTMLERGEQLVVGTRILMRAIGVTNAVIGVEANKPDAVKHLQAIVGAATDIKVQMLKTQYPQGGEKQLIAAVTGRQVPAPPALPIDVGAVVCNASTAVAVYEAVQKNKPLIERVVTVTGAAVPSPKNLLTRFGTPVEALIAKCGGLAEGDVKVINGGPMMGRALSNIAMPVMKGCSGITIMVGSATVRGVESACIKCAKCVEACPMGLEPYLLSKQARKRAWDAMEANDITSCIECGCCQFTCPANIPLLDYIRLGKQTVMGIIRARNMKK